MTETINTESVVTAPTPAMAQVDVKPVEFKSLFSDEYKSIIDSKGFSTADDLAKSYVNLEKMMGNSIRLPNPDSSPEHVNEFLSKLQTVNGVVKIPNVDNKEEVSSFYNKLGRPESADGYDFGDAALVLDENVTKEYKQLAHDIGLTAKQAKALVEFEAKFVPSEEAILANEQRYMASAEQELKKVWGGDYDTRIKVSLDVLEQYGAKHPDAVNELKQLVGNNPALRVMLVDLAKSAQEAGQPIGNTHIGMSSADAEDRINELKKDKGFTDALFTPHHPGHKEAKAKWDQLFNAKHGN